MTRGEPGAQTGPSREIPGSADVQPRAVAHREFSIRRIGAWPVDADFSVSQHIRRLDLASGSYP